MIRRIRCFVADCDDCRTAFDEREQSYIAHFDTDREALDYLADNGWTISTDGHIRCPDCTARHLCPEHTWGVWHICECRGAIPTHLTEGCGFYRTCAHCGAVDITDFTHLPTTDQHHGR